MPLLISIAIYNCIVNLNLRIQLKLRHLREITSHFEGKNDSYIEREQYPTKYIEFCTNYQYIHCLLSTERIHP